MLPHSTRHKTCSVIGLLSLLFNLVLPIAPAAQAMTEPPATAAALHPAPQPLLVDQAAPITPLDPLDRTPAAVLPAWFKPSAAPDLAATAGLTLAAPAFLPAAPQRRSITPGSVTPVLPAWFDRAGQDSVQPGNKETGVLPAWFSESKPDNGQPSTFDLQPTAFSLPPNTPPLRPLADPIPQLSMEVFAPANVSAGDEAVGGNTYTVTVRNGSPGTPALNFYLQATIPATGFTYIDGSASLVSSISGTLTVTDTSAGLLVTWQPPAGFSLAPGEVVTLTFRLTTDGSAVSGQRLDVNAIYENPLGDQESLNAGQNIRVGRGNLVISKSPSIQDATLGDEISWEIVVANTGLGDVYETIITDVFGAGYSNTDDSELAPIPLLAIGQRQTFNVTATVNSCTDLTNVAEASWSIGNEENRTGQILGTRTNPVSDTTDVAYLLTSPDVSVTASGDIDIPYCGAAAAQPIQVVVSNAPGAGAAGNLTLQSNLHSLGFDVGPAAGWAYNPSTGLFTYQANDGRLDPATAATLAVVVTPTLDLCAGSFSQDIDFEARYTNGCNLDFTGPADSVRYSYATSGSLEPTLSVSKSADRETTYTGDTVEFTLTFNAANVENMAGDIVITDNVPASFANLTVASGPTVGSVSLIGNQIVWTVSRSAAGEMNGSLSFQADVVNDPGVCGANSTVANRAEATVANGCPTCPDLTAGSSVDVIIQNSPIGSPGGSVTPHVEVCGSSFTISYTYQVSITTWNGVIFTDTLGTRDLPPGSLNYVANSLQVEVDGVNQTTNITITQTNPQLVLDFGSLTDPSTPTVSAITVTYNLTADNSFLDNNPQNRIFNWSEFTVPGAGSDACLGDDTFYQGVWIDLQRADLQPVISPQSFDGCRIVPVTLTVADPDYLSQGLTATNVVVAFQADPAEIATVDLGAITYGDGFAGGPTSGPVLSGTNTVVWTFANGFAPGNDQGTINFDLQRGCGAGPLNSTVTFADRCGISHTNTGSAAQPPRLPNLVLFVTPDTYMVNERTARWRAYVTNIGDAAATTAIITNIFGSGIRFISETHTTPGASSLTLLTAPPFDPGEDIVWELTNLAPGEQIRIDFFAEVVSCGGVESTVQLTADCLGQQCSLFQEKTLRFIQPEPDIRSSNDQTADLPLCSTGEVLLRVKNASASSHIYNMVISETISAMSYVSGSTIMTVEDANGDPIPGLIDVPFEPVTSTVPGGTLLRWGLDIPGLNPTQTQILADRGPEETIDIRFTVQTSCTSPDLNRVQATAAGEEPCGDFFFRIESAETLNTIEPDITLTKVGRNLTTGSSFAELVYGEPGDQIEWRVTAVNAIGAYIAQNVVVTDTLPGDVSLISYNVTGGTAGDDGSRVIWDLGNLPADGNNQTLTILTTIPTDGSAICNIDSVNQAELTYGCDDGCLVQPPERALATLRQQPNLTLNIPGSASMNVCGGEMTIILLNSGATAYNVILTDTLPTGYEFDFPVETPPGAATSPTAGDTTLLWQWPGLAAGTHTIRFNIRQSATGGEFCASPGTAPNNVAVEYRDNGLCAAPVTHTGSAATSITFNAPNLQISKSPAFQVAGVGETITWTVTVNNIGSGSASGVVVTDTAGSQFENLTHVSNSTGVTANPIGTGTFTWAVGAIPAGGSWLVILTAVLTDSGDNRNLAEVSADCATGCTTNVASDTAYVSLLDVFQKTPDIQTGTIGSLVTFDFLATMSDIDGDYRNIILTDTLPTGLGYVGAVLTYTADVDGGGSPTAALPSANPGQYNSGAVVWNLGNLPGAIEIEGVITAVIQNNPVNYDGARRANQLRLTYLQDGSPYLFTDTADVDIVEPILHLGKSYLTESGCPAELLTYNFNNLSSSGWFALGTWTVTPEGYFQNTSTIANRRAFIGTSTWTDYSFSFMMRTSDPTGSMGGYVRQNSTGTADTGYLFRWSDTQMQLELRSAGTVLATSPGGYQINRWYHVEIRVTGSLIEVLVDGVRRLSAANTNFTNGRVGLLSSSHTQTQFDDILVTRLDNQGCYVGANDLVTYTLTISNQSRLPGYDLVITDAIPAGMSLVTYTLTSNDSTNPTITAEPAPIPGATGLLVWNVDHLTPTVPFNPLAHTALTLTVVLRVADNIAANTILANQASLAYDNWPGNSNPIPTISRNYSGGSHSTAVRTVDAAIRKVIQPIEPPPTATLGTLVTYTLIVPAAPITATLYNVIVTDTLSPPRFYIEAVTVSGGTGASTAFNQSTGLITATFAAIPPGNQGVITITTRISHEFPSAATDPNRGNVITNAAVMTHSTATVLTRTNEVSVTVYEPLLTISKVGAVVPGDPQAVDYTVRITNSGDAVAYGPLVIHDYTPAGVSVSNISAGGQLLPDNRTISWTLASLAGGASVERSYRLRLTEPIYAGNLFTNTAIVTNTSLTATIPGVRPYVTDTVYTFPWPMGRLGDYVWFDADYSGIQNTSPLEAGINGVVIDLYDSTSGQFISSTTTVNNGLDDGYYIFDYLPLGVTYTVQLSSVNFSTGVLTPYLPTRLNAGGPATDSNANPNAVFNGFGYAVTTTLTPAFTQDLTLDFGFVPRMSLGNQLWYDSNDNGQLDADEPPIGSVAVELYQDSNGDGQYTPGVDQLISTTLTTPGGYYTFTNLLPTYYLTETYLVVITSTNFSGSGPLVDHLPSTVAVGGNSDLDEWNHGYVAGDLASGGFVASTPISLTARQEPHDGGNSNYTIDFGFLQLDLGDLPDGYRTLIGSDGARHIISPTNNPTLGAAVDAELDGQPSVAADGDDLNGPTPDDEDGVAWSELVLGQTSIFTITALTGGGYLNGWIDFNADGVFDAGEQLFNGELLSAGVQTFPVSVPATATITGPVYMRFRYSSEPNLDWFGLAPDGEVEDYVAATTAYDFGDLPDSYGTLLSSDGPRHQILPVGNPTLGRRVDAEGDGQPGPTALGDDANDTSGVGTPGPDDEDGVEFSMTALIPGETLVITVSASISAGRLNAWLDLNADGDFNDAGEQIALNVSINAGDFTVLTVIIPADIPQNVTTYARFRFSSQGDLTPTGPAVDGEVEDYALPVLALDYGDLPNSGVSVPGYAPQTYPTQFSDDGPRHIILPVNNPTLGNAVDAEPDGQPTTGANGDDLNGATPDDEDGVQFSGPLVPGETVIITVTASAAGADGYLNAWLDLNSDGVLDAGEQIAVNRLIAAGQFITLTVAAPLTATQGITTYSRFRFSSQQDLTPTGLARDGEIEDHPIPIAPLDFGDLPAGLYPTLYGDNGPRHQLDGTYLGSRVDAEPDGQPNFAANGDDGNPTAINVGGPGDDEDGIVFLTPIVRGRPAQIQVTAGAAGYLNSWFDFDGDGNLDTFTITGINGNPVNLASNSDIFLDTPGGVYTLTFTVPDVPISSSLYSRFRYTTNPNEARTPTGFAPSGEVEDYVLLSLGNLVWLDDGAGGGERDNGLVDGSEIGLPGVVLELRDGSGNPLLDGAGNPITTTTDSNGRYLFTGLTPGDYRVFIPPSNFGPGSPLESYLSSSDTPATANPNNNQDEDQDENGLDDDTPIVNGITSNNLNLTVGSEPQGNGNANFTLDFGFVPGPVPTPVKAVVFTPPPTATLGSVVTYTITAPQPPIARSLVGVEITDILDSRFQPVAATTSGGLTPTVSIVGQQVTARFGQIVSGSQALIAITAIISDPLGAVAGDAITNSAGLTYVGASAITWTNVVATDVGEPRLLLDKRSNPPDGSAVPAGQSVIYTVALVNVAGSSGSPAYDVVLTDTLPARMRSAPPLPAITLDGAPLASPGDYSFTYNPANGVLVITLAPALGIPVGSRLEVEYAAVVDDDILAGTPLTNQAVATWSSLPGDTPGDRDYPPITDSTTLTSTGVVTLNKQLDDIDRTRTISGVVPYRIVLDIPPGLINDLVVTDTLEAGLIYNDDAVIAGPGGNPAATVSLPNDGTADVNVVWSFGAVTNPPANPQPIVITFTAAVADVPPNVDGTTLDNDALASWSDAAGSHVITDLIDADDVITVEVPALVVEKRVEPGVAVPGGVVTWTVLVTNVGAGAAYGIDLRDTLPDVYFTYEPGSSRLNGTPTFDPVVAGLELLWDLNYTLPGGASLVLTFRTNLSPDTPRASYTNIVTAVNGLDEESNPIPPDNRDRVPPDTDPDDSDDATVLVTLLEVAKSVADAVLSPNQVTTYTIQVNNPGGTALTVTVTDTLPVAFAYADNALVDGGPREPDVIAPPQLVWANLGPIAPGGSLLITFRINAATEVNGVYTNTVEVEGDDGLNTITAADDVTVTLTTNPAIVVTKSRTSPSPVAQGQPVIFNLTVLNNGNTTLHTLALTDTFDPAALEFQSADPAPDSSLPGQLVWNDVTDDWLYGDLAPGETGVITLTFSGLYRPGGGTTVNTVQVTGVDTNTITVTATDSDDVTVLSPRLELDKQLTPTGPISPGDVLTYSLCYANSGSLTAANVVITDFVPFNTTYVPGSAAAGAGPVPVEYTVDGVTWLAAEPLTPTAVAGLRWLVGDLLPTGGTNCVQFNVTINMTIIEPDAGLKLRYVPEVQGWAVLDGDLTGLEIIGYTDAPTSTVTPTPTITLTPTPLPTLMATPETTPALTPTETPTPGATPTPVISLTVTPLLPPTPGATPLPTPTPTVEATATPAATLEASPAPPPTEAPTFGPTPEPTVESTAETAPVEATPTPLVDPPTVEPTVEPAPTIEPTGETAAGSLAFQVIPARLVQSAGDLVQPATLFQAQISPTVEASPTAALEPTQEATTEPEPSITVESTEPVATIEPTLTAEPSVEPTVAATAPPTSEPAATVTPTPEITLTLTPEISPTPEPVTPTSLATMPPAITATEPATPTAALGYPIVGFETIAINLVNEAIIGSNNTPTQTDVVTTPIIRIVDPLLVKGADPSQARPGERVNYFIRVENPRPPSNANATNIVVVDALPPELTYVNHNVAASPGVQIDVTVASGLMRLVGHPLGITETLVYTLTMAIPELGPGQSAQLNIVAQVNNVANPPPRTIQNLAIMSFTEGSPRQDDTPVNVPLPPRPRRDDDDDEPAPTPTPTPPPLPPQVTPTPTLPALFLPETGLLGSRTGEGDLAVWLLVVIGVSATLGLFWSRLAQRSNHGRKR